MAIGVDGVINGLGVWDFPATEQRGKRSKKDARRAADKPQQAATIARDDQKPAERANTGVSRSQTGNMTTSDEIRNADDATDQAPRSSQRDIDQALVERAQAGDSRAFDALVIKYQQRVIQLVSRLVSEADAPDVAQEAFIKAYRALPNFRGQSAFYTWLYRIAVNTAKNHLVSRKRRPAGQDIDVQDAELYGHTEHLSDQASPEADLLSEEIRQVVAATIDALPPDLRTAISLREFDGLSYEDIANAMNCPVGTVRSRIFRARAAVDEKLKPLLEHV